MKRTINTPKKLTDDLQAKLETFKANAIKGDSRINEKQFEALTEVYYFITKRVLSKGCSTCVPDAFKIIRNYLALFPDAKPKVLSKNTKRLKPLVKSKQELEDERSLKIAEAVTEANETGKPFEFPIDLDDKEKLEKEMKEDIPEEAIGNKEDSETKEIVNDIIEKHGIEAPEIKPAIKIIDKKEIKDFDVSELPELEAPKKKAPAKKKPAAKKTQKKSNAKASPRERRKRK